MPRGARCRRASLNRSEGLKEQGKSELGETLDQRTNEGVQARKMIGGSKMEERTPNPESEETPDSKPEAGDATGSAAEQAKEREREMEESGEENAT